MYEDTSFFSVSGIANEAPTRDIGVNEGGGIGEGEGKGGGEGGGVGEGGGGSWVDPKGTTRLKVKASRPRIKTEFLLIQTPCIYHNNLPWI